MKKAFVALLSLTAALPLTLAVMNSTEASALLTTLPHCAVGPFDSCHIARPYTGPDAGQLTCVATSVADSICAPTDTACVCSNVPLKAAFSTCVQLSCTVKQSLVTLNITHTVCEDPIRDRRTFYNTLSNVFATAAVVAVLLRFYSKWKSTQEFWYDDYSIIFLMVTTILSSVIAVKGATGNGLGLDIWRVSFRQITDFLHVFYSMELLYFTQLGALKMAILFFYLRLFQGPSIRKLIWGTIIFNAILTLFFFILGLFQCRPMSFFWKGWDNEHEGKCINVQAMAWSVAATSIALDLWLLWLPITQLVNLTLHWKKKLGVASMFGVGAFVTVVSMLRLKSLVKFSNSQNVTWDFMEVSYWSTIEIRVGIICACMPSIRLLLIQAFPRFMGPTTDRSYVYSRNRTVGRKRGRPENNFDDRSGRWEGGNGSGSGGGTNETTTFSSKSSNGKQEEVRTSTVELVRVGSRKDAESDGAEPDHRKDYHAGDWV
ncbi:hypothetical protein BKA65DRAFT_285169 [Rhexocercosporidium sp. MPI-PUGE-AT-0058]|nr:hypothetical protein BKA65DRAFT_285169 [Rhexocercosporidium sp. MPI-PUGE-AT-0058]